MYHLYYRDRIQLIIGSYDVYIALVTGIQIHKVLRLLLPIANFSKSHVYIAFVTTASKWFLAWLCAFRADMTMIVIRMKMTNNWLFVDENA